MDLIFDLLGSPTLEEIRSACDGAKAHVLRSAHRPPSLAALYTLSSQATHEAVHLLCRMLVFDPVSIVIMSGVCQLCLRYLSVSKSSGCGVRVRRACVVTKTFQPAGSLNADFPNSNTERTMSIKQCNEFSVLMSSKSNNSK